MVCTPTTTSSRSGASSEPVRRTALVAPLPGSSGCHALLQQQSLPSATTNYHENRICLTAARSGRGMRCWNHLKQRQFLYHSSFVSPRLKGHVAGIPTAASHLSLEHYRWNLNVAGSRSLRAGILWSIRCAIYPFQNTAQRRGPASFR